MFTNIECILLLGKLIMVVGGRYSGGLYINGSWTSQLL